MAQSGLPDQTSSSVGQLILSLGQQPLTVQLSMVNLPQLSNNNYPEITLQFTPDVANEQYFLTLVSPSQIDINLPQKTRSNFSEIDGYIDVINVDLYQYNNEAKVKDKYPKSTILKGEVTLGDKTIKVQKNQFFIILSQPGIKRLHSISIQTIAPQGLDILFTGKSSGIATGLDRESPVQTIEPSWLSQYLSQEAIAAIIGFITAFTGILIPRLFPEPPQKP